MSPTSTWEISHFVMNAGYILTDITYDPHLVAHGILEP
jgi:hypothetical protein